MPAIQALLIQLLSLLLLLVAIAFFVPRGLHLTAIGAALVQGGLAALISRWRAMAPWWPPIQFFFPVALISLHAQHLPPWIFLAAFFVLLSLYWTTFRTQVPYYPSGLAAWRAVATQLPQDRPISFLDVGSGFGGLVLHLSGLRPESTFSGIELAPLPWLASRLRALLAGSRGRFIRGDYEAVDFAVCDVVFAYLSPAAMPALWRKACAEMRPGSLLLSYEFPIVGCEPHLVVYPVADGPALYGWRF